MTDIRQSERNFIAEIVIKRTKDSPVDVLETSVCIRDMAESGSMRKD